MSLLARYFQRISANEHSVALRQLKSGASFARLDKLKHVPRLQLGRPFLMPIGVRLELAPDCQQEILGEGRAH